MSKSTGRTMRASVFTGVRQMEIRELPVPEPGPGEVLLRVEACGVCGTDNHIFEGELTEDIQPPVVLGHEMAARVESLGEGVSGLEPGQSVAVDPLLGCDCCKACRSGKPNLCLQPTLMGYKLNGGFAQYVLAPAGHVIPMPESAGASGGVLCETLACVINGYDRLAFTAGSTAMILGAGTVGLLWLQMLRSSPCRKILQSEIAEYRREKARCLGADVVVDPNRTDLAEVIAAETAGGVDFIVDATGDPKAVQQAIGLLARGGTFMIFGVCPEGSEVSFDPFELYSKEARIVASKMPPVALDRSAAIIASGRIACDEIVTETRGLDATTESIAAFNEFRDNQVKVAIDPWA